MLPPLPTPLRRRCSALLSLALAAALVVPVAARAASVTVSPLYFSYQLHPGQQQALQLWVGNQDSEPRIYVLESAPYAAALGQPSLASWIAGPAEPFTVPARSAVAVAALVTVPADAAPGSAVGILAARMVGDGDGGVAVSGRAGAVVLVDVGDDLQRTGQLGSIDVVARGSRLEVGVPVTNVGTGHFRTSGIATLQPWPIGAAARAELLQRVLLPGATAPLVATFQRPPAGLLRVTVQLTDGDGTAHVRHAWAWRFPWWVTALFVVALVAGAATLYRRVYARR